MIILLVKIKLKQLHYNRRYSYLYEYQVYIFISIDFSNIMYLGAYIYFTIQYNIWFTRVLIDTFGMQLKKGIVNEVILSIINHCNWCQGGLKGLLSLHLLKTLPFILLFLNNRHKDMIIRVLRKPRKNNTKFFWSLLSNSSKDF